MIKELLKVAYCQIELEQAALDWGSEKEIYPTHLLHRLNQTHPKILYGDVRAALMDMIHKGEFIIGPMWALKLRY